MTDYHSVVNTAKNGRLIRAEIREYVLGMALYHGFYQDDSLARRIYKDDEHRIRQCTFLNVAKDPELDFWVFTHANIALCNMPSFMDQTIKEYFAYVSDTETDTLFYDTKKFRIYNKRLTWGREKKISLTKTIQYIWTNYLAMLFCLYGGHTYGSGWCSINIQSFHMYREAKDKNKTDMYLRQYLWDIVKADCHIVDGIIYFQTPDLYRSFWDMANREAINIYQKLTEGGYLGNHRKEENARRKNKGRQTSGQGH